MNTFIVPLRLLIVKTNRTLEPATKIVVTKIAKIRWECKSWQNRIGLRVFVAEDKES